MIVTIWRHGEAASAITDQLRELTGRGEDDVAFGCRQLHEICLARDIPHPELILHSPWLRTTQTADIIASAFSHARMSASPALQPGGTAAKVDAGVEQLVISPHTPRHLLLVSHQPLVSTLADHYLGTAGLAPPLPPGGLVSLVLEVPAQGCGKLLFWALPPEYEACG